MTKRRSYDKSANAALKSASLGQRKRMDGMSKLMARAGRGLSYRLPQQRVDVMDNGSGESDEEEEEKEEDRPFEPLMIWESPHNGGERLGLPHQL